MSGGLLVLLSMLTICPSSVCNHFLIITTKSLQRSLLEQLLSSFKNSFPSNTSKLGGVFNNFWLFTLMCMTPDSQPSLWQSDCMLPLEPLEPTFALWSDRTTRHMFPACIFCRYLDTKQINKYKMVWLNVRTDEMFWDNTFTLNLTWWINKCLKQFSCLCKQTMANSH